MKPEYAAYIQELIQEARSHFHPDFIPDDAGVVRGRCVDFSKKLKAKFPELKCVPGFCNGEEHLWNVDPDGNIVDATGIQFGLMLDYEPYEEDNPDHLVKIGRCMECGGIIYGKMTDSHKDICSKECEKAFIAYQNSL
jgi:hypothetical protein